MIKPLTIFAIILTLQTYGQNNVPQTKSENATLKSKLNKKESVINEQAEQIESYKQTLSSVKSDNATLKSKLDKKESVISEQSNEIENYKQNLSSLKSDNATLKSELNKKESVINEQLNEIEYYKQTLSLFESRISTESNDVMFKINSVEGNSNTGKVIVEGILVNNGPLRSIQGHKSNAFDPKGNGIKSYKVKLGNEKRINKLLNDVPTQFNVEFEQIIEGTPTIRALIVDFYSNIGNRRDNINVVFKNLDIDWK